jgi:hypothetical protein
MLRYWSVGNCSSRSGQIFFALLLVFVCSERCVGPIPANSTRVSIQRNLSHCPRETKSTCYLTLARPLLECACMVWDPHTAQNTQKLEAAQRRSARFVMNNYQQTSSVTSMLPLGQWLRFRWIETLVEFAFFVIWSMWIFQLRFFWMVTPMYLAYSTSSNLCPCIS